MGNVADKIRNHVGEGELSEAIETLHNYLKNIGGDLYNQAIHLRGSFKEYIRNRDLGMGDNQEKKSRISMAVLNLATEIEQQKIEHTPTKQEFQQSKPPQPTFNQNFNSPFQTPPAANTPPRYIAQCIFNMDSMKYFLDNYGKIYMVHPFTNQASMVGTKLPAQNPQFAWTLYFTTTNIYYLVDHAGIIWGQNYGMPTQYGTVKYFQ